MNIKELIKNQLVYFDGGMGTLLQERGLQPGELGLKHGIFSTRR